MLNFSKAGPITDLIAEINTLSGSVLTPEGGEAEQALYRQAITQAVSMLEATRTDTIKAAHINLRAAILTSINATQLEIQIQGRKM